MSYRFSVLQLQFPLFHTSGVVSSRYHANVWRLRYGATGLHGLHVTKMHVCVCAHVCVRVPHKIKHAPEAWRSWDSWDSNLAYMELIHLTHTKRGSYDTNVLRSGSLHGFCVLTALTTVLLRSETRSQLSEQMEQEMQTTMTPTMQTTQECWRKRNHGRTQILVNPLQST